MGTRIEQTDLARDALYTKVNQIADELDSAAVHLTDDETITGAKTFSNDFSVLGNSIKMSSTGTNCNYPLSFQLPSFTKGNTPTNNVIAGIDFYGSVITNFTDRLGNIDFMVDTSKNSSVDIRAYDCTSSTSTDAAGLSIHYDANGNTYALCPTPSLASNASNYGKQVVNVSYLNGSSSGVVHTTGTETISGAKTFTTKLTVNSMELYPNTGGTSPYIDFHYNNSSSDYTSRIIENNSGELTCQSSWIVYGDLVKLNPNLTLGTAPSAGTNTVIMFSDKNGRGLGHVYHNYATNKDSRTILQAIRATSSSDNAYASIGICYPASGNPYGYAPASDVNGSMVTTVAKSKSQNGYFKLGNGMIVQWGTSSTSNSSGVFTLPTAFTSTNYAVVMNHVLANVPPSQGSNANVVGWGVVQSRTTTNFTAFLCNYENSYWWRDATKTVTWIAIGY